MAKIEREKIRLGVSACLLGERVRYDGGHKRDNALLRARRRGRVGPRLS